jgi:hypothetical protein
VASPAPTLAAPTPTTSAAPTGPLLDAAVLPSLLLSVDEMKGILNAPSANGWETIAVPDLAVTQTRTDVVARPPDATYDPLRCLPAMQAGSAEAYENSGYTATLQVDISNLANSRMVTQALTLFHDGAAAQKAFSAYVAGWTSCEEVHLNWTQPGSPLAAKNGTGLDLGSLRGQMGRQFPNSLPNTAGTKLRAASAGTKPNGGRESSRRFGYTPPH